MPEKRRGNRPGHFPLTIDPWGGVLMTSGEGRKREINFSLQGEGALGLTREVNGADWRVISGIGKGTIDVLAQKDALSVNCLMPFMTLKYSRGSGNLEGALISGVDVAGLAGIRLALEKGDWDKVENYKLLYKDRVIKLTFVPEEGTVDLKLVDVLGKEVVGGRSIGKEEGDGESGLVPSWNGFSWRGNLGLFRGRVGFEVFSGEIVFFYEKGNGDGAVRQNVMGISRTVLGMSGLDWKVTQGMPSEDDLLNFMEEVYLPLL